MLSMFSKNLSTNGQIFTIERNNLNFKGILSQKQGKWQIDLENNISLKINDCIINSVGQRLFIIDIFKLSDSYKSCYCITEQEYNMSKNNSPIFNINANTIENTIIGNQTNATINLDNFLSKMKREIESSNSNDKKELLEIVSLLKEINQSNKPIEKGFLSKFSDVMERNSWITSSVSGFLLNLFLTQCK